MKVIAISGNIGSGKSLACAYLQRRGVFCFDSDSEMKAIYLADRKLPAVLENALGVPLKAGDSTLDRKKLASVIFGNDDALRVVESITHPLLLRKIELWRKSLDYSYSKGLLAWEGYASPEPFAALESAIIAEKDIFNKAYDHLLWIDAPLEMRLGRLEGRGLSRSEALIRLSSQKDASGKADAVISNDSDPQTLEARVDFALNYLFLQR